MTSALSQESVELRQSTANILQGPIFVTVVVLAVVIRQFFGAPPSPIVLSICGAVMVLVIAGAVFSLRNVGATFVVTADTITFNKRHRPGKGAGSADVIERTPGSTLSFRVGRNGPFGSEYTGYILKLRDNATGKEVYAGTFGRRKVQQACESQGWSFS